MVVITGATGLLGRSILEKFSNEAIDVIAFHRHSSVRPAVENTSKVRWVECDVLDIHSLTEHIPIGATVIHAAAHVSFHTGERDKLFKTNVEGTTNIVNVCLTNQARLIHISSVAALGRQKSIQEVDETATWVESPLNSSYGESKHLAELEVYRGIEEGLKATIVCPSFILAATNWDQSSAQIFKYVWHERKFYSGGFANYVDVRDVVQIISKIFQQPEQHDGERYIASAGAISYQQLFTKIAHYLGKRAPSIKISDGLLHTIARLEEIRCFLLGSIPLITRESVKSAGEKFTYSNKKSIISFKMEYHSLEETLQMCCEHYLRAYSTKK
ncbi:MAG: NAD-dependent epimerase/dehydratase family protein [Cyclobacteriaceae bacterium]|nr:NAD-dependent epimerase/dehydratase family protein [Cyclobacteriaceae bacterium]